MKKLIVIIVALGLCSHGIAQEKYVVSASVALNSKNMDDAKENIDKAMASSETNEKPKTLFVKAEIYMAMQNIDKYKASNPYREASEALFKLREIKPEYEKESVMGMLFFAMSYYYNDGANAYNNKKYTEAAEYMKNALKIHAIDPGKQMSDQLPEALKKRLDTASAQANEIVAKCAYYSGQMGDAIPQLVIVKNNPITRKAAIYEILYDAYTNQKDSAEAKATIQEGRKLFPDDDVLKTDELNFYIKSGQEDELIKKLEESAAQQPQNAVLQFNLATVYLGKLSPKSGIRPANADELFAKAEDAFKRAVALDPHNSVYNFNFGSLYYNQAVEVNKQMNSINGTSDADMKKYDDLKSQRDALFLKSTPYFEDAYNQFSAKESSLSADDKDTYKHTVTALKEVYARQNKMDKSAEMKKKLESL